MFANPVFAKIKRKFHVTLCNNVAGRMSSLEVKLFKRGLPMILEYEHTHIDTHIYIYNHEYKWVCLPLSFTAITEGQSLVYCQCRLCINQQ